MVVCLGLSKYQRRARKMIPSSLQNLTATPYMMEHLVCAIYGMADNEIQGISVTREDAESGIKGNLSDSGRLRVRITLTSGQCLTKNWFVKIMLPNGHDNGEFNIFLNEIEFYRSVLPEMKEFVKAEGLDNEFNDFDVPDILYSKAEGQDGAIIVLEDIVSDGYIHERDNNGDKFLDMEKASAAVTSIAKIHAVSVAMQLQKSVDLGAAHPSLKESGLMWAQADMSARLAVMKEHYCEMLEKSSELDSPTLLKRFRKKFDSQERLVELCQNRCKTSESQEVQTLQHGDFHFNNLLFKNTQQGLKVKICDWQLTYTGKQTGDLSYLLMSSLSHEGREDFEEKIKEEYYNAYKSTIQRFAVSKQEPVEKTPLEAEYKETLPFSFFLSCGNIMANESQDRSVRFSYDMCKEAVSKSII